MALRSAPLRSAAMITPRRLAGALLAGALVLGACGGGSDGPSLAEKVGPPPSSSSTTTAPLPSYISLVATAVVPDLEVFDAPGAAEPTRSFSNPWLLNDDPDLKVDLVFLVASKRGSWYQVYLPERPNGSTAWVRGRDVRVTQNRYRIEVDLAAHQMTVYDGPSVFLQEPVATGADATPTPTGTYYVRVLLKNPNPGNVYGPYAYGLSGHSDVLETFNGGDAEVGIHGNNDASLLGTSVSHGCIRMSNAGITRLTSVLPLGTPVTIT